MIVGVKINKRSVYSDERGRIIHMLKSTDSLLDSFGEIYCSTIFPAVVKGWHLHKSVTINYFVIRGNIKFVLYDGREGSSSQNQIQEIIMGESNNVIVSVPPNIWNGFKCISLKESYVVNIQNKPYDENEVLRMDPYGNDIIRYNWKTKDK